MIKQKWITKIVACVLLDNSLRYWLVQLKPECCSEYLVRNRTIEFSWVKTEDS